MALCTPFVCAASKESTLHMLNELGVLLECSLSGKSSRVGQLEAGPIQQVEEQGVEGASCTHTGVPDGCQPLSRVAEALQIVDVPPRQAAGQKIARPIGRRRR